MGDHHFPHTVYDICLFTLPFLGYPHFWTDPVKLTMLQICSFWASRSDWLEVWSLAPKATEKKYDLYWKDSSQKGWTRRVNSSLLVGRVVSGIIGTKKVGSTAVSLRDARLFSTKLLTSSLPFCDRFPLQHNFVMLRLTILYTQILGFIIIFPGELHNMVIPWGIPVSTVCSSGWYRSHRENHDVCPRKVEKSKSSHSRRFRLEKSKKSKKSKSRKVRKIRKILRKISLEEW